MNKRTVFLFYVYYTEPLLYAYTTEKEMSEIFKKQRDMNRFIWHKREMDEDAFEELKTYAPTKSLVDYHIYTKDKVFYKKQKLPFLMTYSEISLVLKWEEFLSAKVWDESKRLRNILNVIDDRIFNSISILFKPKFQVDQLRLFMENSWVIV